MNVWKKTRFSRIFTGFIDEGKSQACFCGMTCSEMLWRTKKIPCWIWVQQVRIPRRSPWSATYQGTKRLGPSLGNGTLLSSNSARNFLRNSTALRNTSYLIANMALSTTEKSNEKEGKLGENRVNFQTFTKIFWSHAHKLLWYLTKWVLIPYQKQKTEVDICYSSRDISI